ncbi:MAG: aminoglycoside phosphotransferase family protein [Gemmatimonadetes bacterium]|nr:aminoglycoside phosphotransferase family protein [Gemmatimonadota bacterium]
MQTRNPHNPERDRKIAEITEYFFGPVARVSKCHSQTNYCAIVMFEQAIPQRLVKLTNYNPHAIEAEIELYPRMAEAGVPVPKIEFTHRDYPSVTDPFMIMPLFSGAKLTAVCSQDVPDAVAACQSCGRLLRNLDTLFGTEFRELQTTGQSKEQFTAIQEGLDAPLDVSCLKQVDRRLACSTAEYLDEFRVPIERQLTHGQFHTENILTDEENRICVVDFGESIALSSPTRDLFYLLWSLQIWCQRDGNSPEARAVFDGCGPLSDEEVDQLRYWELVSYVNQANEAAKRSEDLSVVKAKILEFIRADSKGFMDWSSFAS